MSEHYNIHAQDFLVSGGRSGGLTDEERREMTLRNLAMSKASKAKRKKKKQSVKPGERKLTEHELRMKEQARIRKERAERGAQSEANRREAGIGQPEQKAADPKPPKEQKKPVKKPEKKPDQKPEPKRKAEPTPTDISEINIDVPAEPVMQPQEKEKPKPETKQKITPQKTESRQERAARKNHSRSRSSAAKRYSTRITTGGAVTLGLLTGLLIGTVIYGRVQTNEIYTVINAKQAEYDDLISKNVSMKSEMEGKMTVKNIEEYAENELGLMPLDQSQIVYLQLQTEDEVIITEPEDNLFVTMNDYLVGIWEYLRGK